ncbi:hypothetical protein ST47_g4237 [Ascochyta rabiei]|uniref:Uncharacterized protein n=1 Tax=Didymella rabiei TaxID=5454 RepID=A0A163FTT3_DIDRA|nr:hypothetical protein ST47_g4237 [Ascochyta rabiei]
MLCSTLIAASLATLAVAAPTDMKSAKQVVDTSYGTYKDYGNYGKYGTYPGSVEKAAQAMGKARPRFSPLRDLSGLITSAANSNVKKRGVLKSDVESAADADYGSYGKYETYSNYQTYPGGVEKAGARMETAAAQ